MSRETVTTPGGRVLRVRVVTVGQSFGLVGQLLARNGRVVAETETIPYGFAERALAAARDLADDMGL